MTKQKAIERIKVIQCWKFHDDDNGNECGIYLDNDGLCDECEYHIAIECIEKQIELERGLSDLKATLNEAYKLNDYVLDKVLKNKPTTECEDVAESYSLRAMQNLGWLLGVIE